MFNNELPHYLYDENPGYLVGGALRDLLCGRPPFDYDIAVIDDPFIRASRMAQKTGGQFFKLGGDRFAHFRVVHPAGCIDIAPIRNGDIETDLARRDFTVNAMAYDLNGDKLIDPLNGMDDINNQLIRMTGPDCFTEDPARLIRAHRIAASLNFRIDSVTLRAMAAHSPLISRIPGERIWPEWHSILKMAHSTIHVQALAGNGLLSALFPDGGWNGEEKQQTRLDELTRLEMIFEQPDKYLPTPAVHFVNSMPAKELVLSKTALLMHGMGANTLIQSCNRLRISTAEAKWIIFVAGHRHLAAAIQQSSAPLNIGRFFNLCHVYAPHLLIHRLVELPTLNGLPENKLKYILEYYKKQLEYYFKKVEPLGNLPPLIGGRELMDATGLNPSPQIGELLTAIKEARIEGRIQYKIEALNLARNMIDRC